MAVTTYRRRKAKMYGVVPSGSDYYAFWSDGRAGLYVDGSFVSYRSTSGPSIPEAPSLIHTDSEAIVGPGSIVTRIDETHLEVWDVDGETTHSYEVPAGYVCSPAIYADGFLWWVEREAVQHGGVGTHATDFRLRRARTDLDTDLGTVDTYEALHYIGFSVAWGQLVGLALTAAAAIVQCHWMDNVSGEVQDDFQVRFELDGGGATDNGWPVIGPGTNVDPWIFNTAPPTPIGVAAGATAGFLAEVPDDAEASPSAFWSGAEWELGDCANVSLSADGSEGALYGGVEIVRGPASAGTPTNRFTVDVGVDDDTPNYMFIKG